MNCKVLRFVEKLGEDRYHSFLRRVEELLNEKVLELKKEGKLQDLKRIVDEATTQALNEIIKPYSDVGLAYFVNPTSIVVNATAVARKYQTVENLKKDKKLYTLLKYFQLFGNVRKLLD